MSKPKKTTAESFWDDLHYTKVLCPYCKSRLPSKNDDGVTPNHCLNLCTLPHGAAMKFQAQLRDIQHEIDRRKAIEKVISEE